MNVLIYCLITFFIAFTVHFIIWRIHLPRNQTKALLYIFFIVLTGSILLLWFLPDFYLFGTVFFMTIPEYAQFSLLFISLTLAYLTTYSAVEVDSPSLSMVLSVNKAGADGLEKDFFVRETGGDILVRKRVEDLFKEGFISFDGKVYKIEPKGRLLASIFIFYTRLLRINKGG